MGGFGSVSVTSLGGSGRKDGGSERCAVLPKWTHITYYIRQMGRGKDVMAHFCFHYCPFNTSYASIIRVNIFS